MFNLTVRGGSLTVPVSVLASPAVDGTLKFKGINSLQTPQALVRCRVQTSP